MNIPFSFSFFTGVFCFLFLLIPDVSKAQINPYNIPKDSISQKADTTKSARYEQIVLRSADLEINGLIVDETITKIGRDFYEVFFRTWEAPPISQNFTIQIKEKPTRGNGALIQVALNDDLLFEQQLQPRYDIIEEVATYAAVALYDYLINDQLNKQLEAEGRQEREVF